MDEGARHRTFVETPEYSAQFETIAQTYSDELLEDLLRGVFWALETNAEQFGKGTWNLRRARSRSFEPGDPQFEIIFEIRDANTIGLLWIREISGMEEIKMDDGQ